MTDSISLILSNIMIGAVTAWITVQLSLKKFRSERWWERKADAYIRIIESLHKIKRYVANCIDAFERGDSVGGEALEFWREANNEIELFTETGAFLLSKKCFARFKKYKDELDEAGKRNEPGDVYSLMNDHYHAVDLMLTDMIVLAKDDLKIV